MGMNGHPVMIVSYFMFYFLTNLGCGKTIYYMPVTGRGLTVDSKSILLVCDCLFLKLSRI